MRNRRRSDTESRTIAYVSEGTAPPKSKKDIRREELARTAFDLFIEQGYEKTTMRQIAFRAKILNGSLYNLFSSKDEIFKHIMVKAIGIRQSACTSMVEEEKDYLFALALPFVLELYACEISPKLTELFHRAYSNWDTFNRIVDLDIHWMTQVSEKFGLGLDQEHLRRNTVAIDGCLTKLIDAAFFTDYNNPQDSARTLMIIMFTLLNLPLHGIDHLLQRYEELIRGSDVWSRLEIWPGQYGPE